MIRRTNVKKSKITIARRVISVAVLVVLLGISTGTVAQAYNPSVYHAEFFYEQYEVGTKITSYHYKDTDTSVSLSYDYAYGYNSSRKLAFSVMAARELDGTGAVDASNGWVYQLYPGDYVNDMYNWVYEWGYDNAAIKVRSDNDSGITAGFAWRLDN